ncbi:unnamed protein product [Dicrocoelium dendriticum]|nr:unnamed protein product [Dicrocoelium dendriticum]
MQNSKVVQDAVHGMIELEPLAKLIVDTPEFQRLREIRQLGLAHLVFPSCQHTRFEHSIGTYHMTKRLATAINCDAAYIGPRMTSEELLALKIAALCHDLGHGPFSHTWEVYIKHGGIEYRKYKHEKLSCLVLERIVKTNSAIREHFAAANIDLDLVKSLILGKPLKNDQKSIAHNPFIYEILSNNANGMDVDKWDYLLRDCLHAGLGQGCAAVDLDRFMHFCRPAPHPLEDESYSDATKCEWHLSFRDTELENVLRTFGLRQHLHQKLYQHKTVTAISHMVMDALELAEPLLKLRHISLQAFKAESPSELDAFLRLHDSILWDIYHQRIYSLSATQMASQLVEASELIHRILTRQLYVYIDSVFEVHTGSSTMPSRKGSASLATNRLTNNLHSVVACMSAREPFLSETLPSDCRIVGQLTYLQTRKVFCAQYDENPQDTATMILDEIYARLPRTTVIKDKSELLVAKSSFTSNSTLHAPEFYFYTRNGRTFVYEEPLRVVHAYRLYWRGYRCQDSQVNTDASKAILDLSEAFDSWHRDKVGDRYPKTSTHGC